MACRFCQVNVFGSSHTWDFHHTDPRVFLSSAQSGCVLCRRLARDAGGPDGISRLFSARDPGKAIYRWSIKKAAKIRESQQYVTITFRPLPGVTDLGEVDFVMLPEKDLGALPTQWALENDTGSKNTRDQIRRWVKRCSENHPQCTRRHKDHDLVPTRLLDLGTGDSSWPLKLVRLLETDKSFRGPYMTLSHCWGTKHFLNLEDHNLQQFLGPGLPWDELIKNRAFEHAIEITRSLGIRYLWIDSLCIIQRQPDLADWKKEAQLMHRYYRNSWINIAASASKDSEGGLFHHRADEESQIIPRKFVPEAHSTLFKDHSWYIIPADLWSRELLDQPLYTRAWVFQERLLSPRIIHFSSKQVFWDCATVSACEAIPEGLPGPLDHFAVTDRHWRRRLHDAALSIEPIAATAFDSIHEFWKSAVATYTRCKLTDQNDRLKAFWGVAKLIRDASGEEYGDGLWANGLSEQLAWRTISTKLLQHREPIFNEGQEISSWTWASTKMPVEVADRFPLRPRFYFVTDHEGLPVSFRLKDPLFQSRMDDGFQTWNEAIQNMTQRLERTKLNRHVGTADSKNRDGQVTCGDLMPTLARNYYLPIQGLFGNTEVQFSEAGNRWFLFAEDYDDDASPFTAFPDYRPSQALCSFLILGVSFDDDFNDEFDNEMEDELEGDFSRRYSGVGILVEHIGMAHFRRCGAFKFTGIGKRDWHLLRLACGQSPEELTIRPVSYDGLKLWLR